MKFKGSIRMWVMCVMVLCAASMMSSCKYRYMEKPERLLTHDEMVDIICEAAYIEALESRGAFLHDSTLARVGKKAFLKKMYQKYGITHEVLRQNNEYYSEHSKEYILIYRDALDRILADESEYEENVKRAAREAEEAARAKIKATEDSITDARVRDSIILAREDSIMNLHRTDGKSENAIEEESDFGDENSWLIGR